MGVALFDSHAHLGDPPFDSDRQEVLARARVEGVRWVISPGANRESSRRAVAVAEENQAVFAGVGISPHDAQHAGQEDWEALRAWTAHPRVVAWGEIGLDYHYEISDREKQKLALRRQLELAREADLPVILHFRDADPDFFDILEREGIPVAGGVMHCFTGTAEQMARALDLGLYISFSGAVTFRKSVDNFGELVACVPEDRLLVETDAPYMAPVPYRGRRSEPFMVTEVVRRAAEIRGIGLERAARITRENAMRLFRIQEEEG